MLEYLQQPIVRAVTNELVGVELLARFGNLGPPPLVLGNNPADWLMLDIAGLSRIRYSYPMHDTYMVFINLSRHVVHSTKAMKIFLQACYRTMDETNIDAVIEIDEETQIPDKELINLARRIQGMGMSVAMDDHRGTEACYHRANLDCWDIIKVCTQNRGIEEACKDIARLTANGVPIVAEAIENETEYAAVCQAGASWVQGWYTGKPSEQSQLTKPTVTPRIIPLSKQEESLPAQLSAG